MPHHLFFLDVILVAAVCHVEVVRASREFGRKGIHLFHVRTHASRLPLASNLYTRQKKIRSNKYFKNTKYCNKYLKNTKYCNKYFKNTKYGNKYFKNTSYRNKYFENIKYQIF